MMDTRLVAPITEDCALVVHSTLGHYKCVQGGKLTCYKHGDSKRIYTLSKGDLLFLDPRDTCTSTCTQKRHSTGYHKVPPLAPTRMGRGLPRPCADPAEAPSELDTTATLFSLPLASVPWSSGEPPSSFLCYVQCNWVLLPFPSSLFSLLQGWT